MPAETAYAPSEPEDWFVFETFVADGTLAIGAARGILDPSAGMVVGDGLTRKAAHDLASRLAAEHRAAGRPLDALAAQELATDSQDV